MVKRIAIGTVLALTVGYLALIALLYLNQRALFFTPDGRIYEISETRLTDTELVTMPTTDEQTITGWYAPPVEGMPTIIYYKGNQGSFTAEYPRFEAFAEAGYGFLAIDYRGFPLSEGSITQENILDDALAAYDWAAEQGDPILIWGRSLGASPAVYVASRREAAGVLLETPFYSAVSVAAERYPFVPVRLLMRDQFRSNEWIADVEAPVFVVHGTADTIVSVSNGERLFSEVINPYELWIEEGAGHNDFWTLGVWERARVFFETAMAAQ